LGFFMGGWNGFVLLVNRWVLVIFIIGVCRKKGVPMRS
jgi:hypothetical protein